MAAAETGTQTTSEVQRTPRLRRGALIAAGSAVALGIVMFAMAWYGVDEIPGRVPERMPLTHAVNAWHALSLIRWLMLLTVVVAIGSVLLHGSQRAHGAKTDTGAVVAALGALTAAALIVRVLIALPSASSVVDQKLGAYIGLLCAVGIALGGHEQMLEERARRARAAPGSRAARRVSARASGRS
jgi:hypothetical protein